MGCTQSSSPDEGKTPTARSGFLKGIKAHPSLFHRTHKIDYSVVPKFLEYPRRIPFCDLYAVGSAANSDGLLSQEHTPRYGLKVLVVCESCDEFLQELCSTIDENSFSKRITFSPQQALAQFPIFMPNIVILDSRQCHYNENLLRSLRSVKIDNHPLFVALCKSVSEKDEITIISSAVKAGFDKVMMDTTNIYAYLLELSETFENQDVLKSTIALNESVYVALDKSRDLVIITDQSNTIHYINSPCLHILGYGKDEMLGTKLTVFNDFMDFTATLRQLEKGFDWVGKMRWRCKTGEAISIQCRAVPFTAQGTLPTHYIYLQDNPLENHIYPRGSLPSIRKGSYDLKSIVSEGSARRQSLAKLYNLPLEAPITKVLSLLCAAQENASPPVIQMLEQVMDILRTTELYTSQLKVDNLRAEDPLTTNLIAALVAQGPPSAVIPRRTSNESITIKKKPCNKKNNIVVLAMSRDLKEHIDKVMAWDFDVMQVEKLTAGKPLVYVGMKIFMTFSVHKTLGIDDKTIYGWLNMIERHYKPHNTYHNSTHAADVLQATACFLTKLRDKKLLDPLDEACCVLAAAAHDVGHPGKSSAFLTNAGDDLAILYNDISVLEQHHAALTFKLTLKDERVNVFKGLDRKAYTSARACVVDMILATDMFKHFEHYTKFVTVFNKSTEDNCSDNKCEKLENNGKTESELEGSVNPEDVIVVKRMLIKCADVSNPTRPLKLCKQWAKRIAEEYFTQTDEEKSKNLPVVMPLFDRHSCSIPVSQMGFMDYIVNNMFEEWDSFIEMPEMLYHLRKNYDYWKELHDKGITGIDDVEKPDTALVTTYKGGKLRIGNEIPSGKDMSVNNLNSYLNNAKDIPYEIKMGNFEQGYKLEERSKVVRDEEKQTTIMNNNANE